MSASFVLFFLIIVCFCPIGFIAPFFGSMEEQVIDIVAESLKCLSMSLDRYMRFESHPCQHVVQMDH